jgi:hypothetical protein
MGAPSAFSASILGVPILMTVRAFFFSLAFAKKKMIKPATMRKSKALASTIHRMVAGLSDKNKGDIHSFLGIYAPVRPKYPNPKKRFWHPRGLILIK